MRICFRFWAQLLKYLENFQVVMKIQKFLLKGQKKVKILYFINKKVLFAFTLLRCDKAFESKEAK